MDELDDLDAEFAALDAELDVEFEQQDEQMELAFQQVKLAVDRAYKGLTKKIEVNWGEDVALPEKAKWTTYNEDFSTRASFDFELGVYRVETVVTDDVANSLLQLKHMADQIAKSSPAQLQQQDVLYQSVSDELEMQVIDTPQLAGLLASAQLATHHVEVKKVLPDNVSNLIEKIEFKQVKQTPAHKIDDGTKPTDNGDNVTTLVVKTVAMKPSIELQENNKDGRKKLVLTIPFVNEYHQILMDTLLDTVNELARQYRIDVSLIMAIIETESSFNPMATSPIPAFGLMQLVPNTGAVDAYHFIYGEKKVVTPKYLYNQVNNLRLGTAYLHLLSNRYLGRIDDPQSRLYCILASYNIGIGNLAHTLIGRKSIRQAVKKANTMQPSQLYDFLHAKLPAEETRNYLVKVLRRKSKYSYLDGTKN
jgi:membrane-bound lytic murein transglycosylase C